MNLAHNALAFQVSVLVRPAEIINNDNVVLSFFIQLF
jgi:hypothetical protein